MKGLKDLICAAKNDNQLAMLEIIDMFKPAIQKYTRLMKYSEDAHSDIVLTLIELIHAIDLDKLTCQNDYALINYISKTLYHKYIYISRLNRALSQVETQYDSEQEIERTMYDPSGSHFTSDVAILDLLNRELTQRESYCILEIVLRGRLATEVAAELGVTKQAINQCKKRSLEKLKKFFQQDTSMLKQN